jgi:heme exporter protein B
MQIFFTILRQELLLSSQNLGKILANFLFFLISVSLFFLLAQNQENKDFTGFYSITIILFSLLSCLIFSGAEFLKKDFEDGTIEQILISCPNFEIFTLAKILANWLIFALPILILLPLISLMAKMDFVLVKNFLILTSLASLSINFISAFCGSLSIFENSSALIGTIALPLTLPILLVTFSGAVVADYENFVTSCKILGGFAIFIGSISTLATAKIVKIAAE